MTPQARFDFLQFIDQYGEEIYKDRQKFKSLLNDAFKGDFKAEKNVLVSSIATGVPERLLDNKDTIAYQSLRSQCISLIQQEGFEPKLAQWATDTWAIAFKIIDEATSIDLANRTSIALHQLDVWSNDIARSQFLQLVSRYGMEIYKEPAKFRSLLNDFLKGKYKGERNVLVDSIIAGVPSHLEEKKGSLSYTILQAQCVDLIKAEGYGPGLALWAVDTWAMGLDILEKKVSVGTTGYVNITSTPSGATVFLDGIKRGDTPLNLSDIPAGSHQLKCSLDGYHDWNDNITVNSGEQTDVPVNLTILDPASLQSTGAPVVTIPVPPGQSPSPLPTTPGKSSEKVRVIAAVFIIGVFLIGGIYMMNSPAKKSTTTSVASPSQTPTPIITPIPVTTRMSGSSGSRATPQYTGKYVDLQSTNQFNMEPTQQKAPFTVKVIAYPLMIHDQKVSFRGTNDETGETFEIDRPTEGAEYSISVKKKITGEILLSERCSNFASSSDTKEWTIYSDGPYVIDLSGRFVTLDLHAP